MALFFCSDCSAEVFLDEIEKNVDVPVGLFLIIMRMFRRMIGFVFLQPSNWTVSNRLTQKVFTLKTWSRNLDHEIGQEKRHSSDCTTYSFR